MFRFLNYIQNGENDGFNKNKGRNVGNTNRHAFNCGGYALGTFSWYCPYTEEEDGENGFGWGWDSYEEVVEVTEHCTEQMLKDFSDLRVINSLSELNKTEYAIAFRVSSDGDFHYVKRGFNGQWYHKRGSCPSIETMTAREVFRTAWCLKYNGPIVLFAKQK